MAKEKVLRVKLSPADCMIRLFCSGICLFFVLIFLIPLGYVLLSSVHTGDAFSLEGYQLLLNNPAVLTGLRNSIYVTCVGTLFSLLLELPMAYVMSKRQYGWLTNVLYFLSNLGVAILPLYLVLKRWGLINNLWGLILPSAISFHTTQMLRSRMLTMQDALEDAARLDGCSTMQFLLHIGVPTIAPTVAVGAFNHAVGYWSATLLPQTILTDESKYTFTMIMQQMLIKHQSSALGMMDASIATLELAENAVCVIGAIPLTLLFLILRKKTKYTENAGGVVL